MLSRLMRTTALALSLAVGLGCGQASAQIANRVDSNGPPKPFLTLQALRAKYADKAGHIALIGGVEVYYKDEGKGPALLMVHGSESTLKTWDGIVAKLKGRYRIIRFDIPPQGLSGPVSDEALARLQPTDIPEQLLSQLGVKSVTFVGVSSGGTMGIQLAAKRPDLVNRLIVSNAPSDPVVTTHLPPKPSFTKVQEEAKTTGFKTQTFWNEFLTYFSGDGARMSPYVREQYYDFGRRYPEKNPIGLVARVADHDKAVEAMAEVKAPTLLIWGGADLLLPPSAGETMAKYLKNAQVSKVILPDVGHYPPVEVPERFADMIAAYVEDVTPNAGPKPAR
jgi:pimeloyl-ACP methyl ester carboxylesterase